MGQADSDLEFDGLVPEIDDPSDAYFRRQEIIRLLNGLPPKQRACLVMRYFEGMSDDEAASVLGCTTSTFRSNVARALRALRISQKQFVQVEAL